VTLKTCAVFKSDIPSDQIDEEGFEQFGGLNLAEALSAMLVRRGYRVEPPWDGGLDGWMLNIRKDGRRYWLQVSEMDAVQRYLVCFDMSWVWLPRRARYEAFLQGLDEDLRKDGRFHEIVWLLKEQDPYELFPPASATVTP